VFKTTYLTIIDAWLVSNIHSHKSAGVNYMGKWSAHDMNADYNLVGNDPQLINCSVEAALFYSMYFGIVSYSFE